MYIGGTNEAALESCIFELIANSMAEHLARRCSSITVTIHDDGSLSVKDDGGGISVAIDPVQKISFLEMVLTSLLVHGEHLACSQYSFGLRGVGAKCVNAVSEWMKVSTVWQGDEYQIVFARGEINKPLTKSLKPNLERGTIVRFKPDPEIFKVTKFDRNALEIRLQHLAVLHPGLEFWLVDERPNAASRPLVACFKYPGGIADFLAVSCPANSRMHPEPIVFQGEAHGVKIACGFQFTDTGNTSVLSFANSSPTRRHGTHVQGFLQGLADAFNELAAGQLFFRPKDLRAGLNAFVGVWLTDPRYPGATKDELFNPEVELAMHEFTAGGLRQWAAESGERTQWLIEWLDEERQAGHETDNR